jgi:nitroreductase/dihydropteridine reductase
MEFQQAVQQRYATKLFDGRAVPDEKLRQLLEIVRWAPSGLNIQPWKIKVIEDAATKERLSAASFDEPQIKSCSHLLVFCADTDINGLTERLGRRIVEEGVPEFNRNIIMEIASHLAELPREAWEGWAKAQVYIACCYAVLAAKDLGFDSCPMTHFEPDKYHQILELSANLAPTILCPVGYAADTPLPKWRYSLDEILVH